MIDEHFGNRSADTQLNDNFLTDAVNANGQSKIEPNVCQLIDVTERVASVDHETTVNKNPITIPPQENYICKVQPSDFDLILDCLDDAIVPSVDAQTANKEDSNNNHSINGIAIVLAENQIEDHSVEKGVCISSKPALVAVKLATKTQPIEQKTYRSVVYSSDTSILLPILIENAITNNTTNPTVETTNTIVLSADVDSSTINDSVDTDSDSKSDITERDLPGELTIYQKMSLT